MAFKGGLSSFRKYGTKNKDNFFNIESVTAIDSNTVRDIIYVLFYFNSESACP